MSLFSLLVFDYLLEAKDKCKSYKVNGIDYKRCVKLQKISDEIFELFTADRKILMEQYYSLLEDTKVQEFINIQMNIQKRLDDDMDKYIDSIDQSNILNEFVSDVQEVEFNENEFDGFNH